MELTALLHSVHTDVPAVVVDSYQVIAKTFHPDGIERTGDGFYKARASLPISTFQGTEATTLLVAGENAVTTADNAGDEIALRVRIGYALLVDDSLRRRAEFGPHLVERVLYAHDLIHRHRSARIAFHAALSLALLKVATEFFGDNVGRYQYVADLKNMTFHNQESLCYQSISSSPCSFR